MANNPSAGTAGGSPSPAPSGPLEPPTEPLALDSAPAGDIRGAFGTIRQHDETQPWAARPGARAARDHRSGPDRHGRGQRRRRRRDLFPGRPGLRHEPAVGAAAARAGADRQPGNGRAARRGHRRRVCAADQRALRTLLGMVLGQRPVRAELPDDRHRVHRRQPRARLSRRLGVRRGPDRRGRAGAITATGSFRAWERGMFVFVFANLLVSRCSSSPIRAAETSPTTL